VPDSVTPVLAFVGDVLPQDVADLRLRILEGRDGTLASEPASPDEEVGASFWVS